MVSVDQPASALDPKDVARAHRAIEPLHSHLYFAPEHDEHLTGVGLRPGRMCYFAGRAAPMGPVGAGVVTATFYNFSPSLVARMIPRAWTLASPEQVLAARLDAARASLTRLLGEAATSPRSPSSASCCARPPRCSRPRGARSTPGTPTCPGPRSRCWSCGTGPRCCASTAATGTSPRCCTPGWRARGARHPHRDRPGLHRGRRQGHPRLERRGVGRRSAALADRGLVDDAGSPRRARSCAPASRSTPTRSPPTPGCSSGPSAPRGSSRSPRGFARTLVANGAERSAWPSGDRRSGLATGLTRPYRSVNPDRGGAMTATERQQGSSRQADRRRCRLPGQRDLPQSR